MGLFDKAESRVVRHTSGMNKNVRFNEYGKKIFNIPEKETYETIEEGYEITQELFGFNKKKKQNNRNELLLQRRLSQSVIIEEKDLKKYENEFNNIIKSIKNILKKEISGCTYSKNELKHSVQDKTNFIFHDYGIKIFDLSGDNLKKFINNSKNKKLKNAKNIYEYPKDLRIDIENRLLKPVKGLGLANNKDKGVWTFSKFNNNIPYLNVTFSDELAFDFDIEMDLGCSIIVEMSVVVKKENQENVEEGLIAKIIQGPENVKEELPEYEKKFREMNMQKTIKENTNRNFLQSLGNKTKLCVLENVLSSIYYDALYLDDDFKEYNRNIITESVHKFLDERGGYKYIQEAYYKNKSPLLKEIMRICEETSNEINKRKIEESKNAEDLGQNLFNFNMTSEEEKKLDYSKEQIGLKQVSNVIKEKVLNVVKEEKKRESEHEELLTEIENELSENPDVNNPEAVAEALNKIFIGNINIEEGTLFNSLLRYDLKSVIESGYESLDLIKEENCEDDNELNNMSLESIISEAEERNYNDEEIYNDKMKDLFDDFIEKVEEGCDFGKTDEESILYAFESTESKMDEIVNSTLDFNELIDIRRDFRLMQNVIETALIYDEETVECTTEGKCGTKEGCGTSKCKEGKCSTKEGCGTSKCKEGKCSTKEGCGTSKCKEGCNNKGKCTTEGKCGTKEGIDESILEDLEFINDELDDDLFGVEEGIVKNVRDKYDKINTHFMEITYNNICKMYTNPKQLKKFIEDAKLGNKLIDDELKKRENDDSNFDIKKFLKQLAILSIPGVGAAILIIGTEFKPKFLLKRTKKYNSLIIKIANKRLKELENESKNKVTKEGIDESILEDLEFIEDELDNDLFDVEEGCSKKKKCKEGCDKEDDDDDYDDDDYEDDDNKCKGDKKCKKNKCEEGCGTSKCKEGKCSTKEGCGTSKCKEGKCSTKEGCGTSKCKEGKCSTKEGCGTSKCKEGCGTSKCKEGKCSTKEGCGTSKCKEGKCSTKEGCGTSKCKEGKCSTKEGDVSVKTIDTTFENCEDELLERKAVKEAAILVLEDCINEIDNKISKHTDAEEFASNEVYVTENYKTYVIPIMKKSDTTLSGLKLPYKMKAVLESIINTIDNYDNCENIKAIKKVIDTNKSNVSAILEAYKGIPSTPLYKINYFNTFNDLINILDNKVDEILETYDNIEFDDYIYENGVGLYYDEDTFNIITESVDDEFNPDEVNAIDMDYILADTIAKYTLMETMYTIKLEDYNYDSIRKMTNNMLNK